MSKSLILLLLLAISAFSFSQESYTVTAKSGLTIRNEPNPDGQKIGKLEYGMVVTIVEKTDVALTVTDEGKQIRGNWVKVTFDHIPKFISETSSGFVFDGYLKKVASNASPQTTSSSQKLELYKLSSSENTPNGKVGFVSLTDGYSFNDDENSMVIATEHLGEQEFKDDNYHVVADTYRSKFLNSLNIQETDSIFIYHFSSDVVFSSKVSSMPVVAKISPYETQAPVSQSDYMIGFEIGEAILNMADLKNYTSTTLGFIGEQNPFLEGQLRPVLWEKVDASRFPTPKQIVKDSLAIIENTPNTTFEFTSGVLRYFLQNQTKTGRLSARHFKVLSTDRDSLVFDKVFKAGEGANLLRLNTVQNKKQNIKIAIWTGKLFKDKPPIITDFISHSFGCPEIYFLEDSEPPISIRCDNRH